MTLLERLKKEQIEARKNKDQEKSSLLTTILGEIERAPQKSTTDEDVEQIVRSWIKKILKDIKSNPFDGQEQIIASLRFVENNYLPKINKLSEDEIKQLVLKSGATNKRDLMQYIISYEKNNNVVIDKGFAAQLI